MDATCKNDKSSTSASIPGHLTGFAQNKRGRVQAKVFKCQTNLGNMACYALNLLYTFAEWRLWEVLQVQKQRAKWICAWRHENWYNDTIFLVINLVADIDLNVIRSFIQQYKDLFNPIFLILDCWTFCGRWSSRIQCGKFQTEKMRFPMMSSRKVRSWQVLVAQER